MKGIWPGRLCALCLTATFNILDNNDYGNIFITQVPRSDNVVSLEDNSEFRSILDPQILIFLMLRKTY